MKSYLKVAFFAAMIGTGSQVFATDYPNKSLRVIVPFAAGGITDVVSRIVAQEMSNDLGQTIIVENKPGVGGSLGAKFLSQAAPDGYTLGVTTNGTMAANKFLYKDIGYDPESDFDQLAVMFAVPYMIIASESSGLKSFEDLMKRAEGGGEKLSMANGGYGTAVHLMAESFTNAAQIEVSHIPYKGEAPAVTDVLGGHAPLGISSYSSIAQHIPTGKVTVLAVTSKDRLTMLPDVPTLSELGYDLPVKEAWFGLAAPKGLDPKVTERIEKSISTSLNSAAVNEKVSTIGGRVINSNAAESKAFVKSEIPRWGQVIQQANIKPN